MTYNARIMNPIIAAAIAAVVMFLLRDGCSTPTPPMPTAPLVRTVVQSDSINLDSLRATMVPRTVVRFVPVTGTTGDTLRTGDSLRLADSIRASIALAAALEYIDSLLARMQEHDQLSDIVAVHDTTIADSAKQSLYAIQQRYSYATQSFGLTLSHQFMHEDPTFWTYVQRYSPWIVGILGALKLFIPL